MNNLKLMAPLLAALLASACVSLDGVSFPGGDTYQLDGDYRAFHCDNGYRVSVKYKSPEQISINFSTGKDIFVVIANSAPAASGSQYVNDLGNLRWHEQGNAAHFTYPANDWRSSGRLLETTCRIK
ncbi:MAG: MliC family protein [Pseudomonadota bacterium]|nr:MliC family protein [Pseudomonadota bacterium]